MNGTKRLRDEYEYNLKTGEERRSGQKIGFISRRSHSTYMQVYVDGKTKPLTHLIFWIMNGEWPSLYVDHIDGNGMNNRWQNLRLAERWQNMANQGVNVRNTSGYKGVYFAYGKWRARIQVKGKRLHLGCFEDREAASAAYVEAARKYFGEFFELYYF